MLSEFTFRPQNTIIQFSRIEIQTQKIIEVLFQVQKQYFSEIQSTCLKMRKNLLREPPERPRDSDNT